MQLIHLFIAYAVAGFANDVGSYESNIPLRRFGSSISCPMHRNWQNIAFMPLSSTSTTGTSRQETEFILQNELRAAAMKLHTHEQSPKEGQAQEPSRTAYTPTHADYLSFLVDSQHVYQAMEDFTNTRPEVSLLRNTGLERVQALEQDIKFMMTEYSLKRPEVGIPGLTYADHLRSINSVPEFICHFYNFYFAHTAGGRMIGKQMSALLLNKKTLEFYKVSYFQGCFFGVRHYRISSSCMHLSVFFKKNCHTVGQRLKHN